MADSFVLSNDFRGGRCKDIPTFLNANQCADALNVDFYYSRCGNKRWGSGFARIDPGFLPWGSLLRHQPGLDESLNELWAFNHSSDLAHQVMRSIGSSFTTAAWVTLTDPLLTTLFPKECGAVVRGASFNGKLFLAYASAVDRLHVWDGNTVRRVGIARPLAAPTVVSTPAGAVADTRKYKMQWTYGTGAMDFMASELSDFTLPVLLTSQYVTLQPPAPPAGETISNWTLYAFSDDDNYATGYKIGVSASPTGTLTDNFAVLVGDSPPEIGLNTPPSSWKYLMVHGNRLIGAGSWTQPGPNNRVWYTAPLGSGDAPGDDERVPVTLAAQNYLDIDENDGGFIVGFGGVINGSPVVFKTNGIHRLIPTGNAANPYQVAATPVSKSVGAIRQEAIVMAEDENGNPAAYWLARNGPHRYSPTKGVEYCGYDIEDLWERTVAGDSYGQPHAIWYPNKKQIWWYLADATTPLARCANQRLVLHTKACASTGAGARGGWVVHDGAVQVALASVPFITTIESATFRDAPVPTATVTVGAPLRPYVSLGNYHYPAVTDPVAAAIVLCDIPGLLTDLGLTYQAYVVSPAYMLGGLANRFTTMEPLFLARNIAPRYGTPLSTADAIFGAVLHRDFLDEQLFDLITTPSDEASLASPYQVRRMALAVTGAHVAQIRYGDVGVRAGSANWTFWWGIEAVMLQRTPSDERA